MSCPAGENSEIKQLMEVHKPFRDRLVNTWWSLESSPLYHNVNCEIIIISADQQILLTKRSNAVKFSPGVWSASIEEQFIRYDPEEGIEDKDLFECVERGAGEELGTEIDTNRTRLLNIGVEWGNFTAALLRAVCQELQSWMKNGT